MPALTGWLRYFYVCLFCEYVQPPQPLPSQYEDTPVPDPSGNSLISDLLDATLAAEADRDAKAKVAQQGWEAFSAANGVVTTADAALSAGLTATGPVFRIDTATGNPRVYFSDSSGRGWHSVDPLPVNTAVPAVTPPDSPPPAA